MSEKLSVCVCISESLRVCGCFMYSRSIYVVFREINNPFRAFCALINTERHTHIYKRN